MQKKPSMFPSCSFSPLYSNSSPKGEQKYPPIPFIIAYPAQLSHLFVNDFMYNIISTSFFATIITFLPEPPANNFTPFNSSMTSLSSVG